MYGQSGAQDTSNSGVNHEVLIMNTWCVPARPLIERQQLGN